MDGSLCVIHALCSQNLLRTNLRLGGAPGGPLPWKACPLRLATRLPARLSVRMISGPPYITRFRQTLRSFHVHTHQSYLHATQQDR